MICKEDIIAQTTEYTVEEDLVIRKMESYTISSKAVYINDAVKIKCSGDMQFENCVIYCNNTTGYILAQGSGVLQFKNCVFLNQNVRKNIFFMRTGGYDITFENCYFENCAYLVYANGNLLIENCKFYNCFNETISFNRNKGTDDEVKCHIQNIIIENEDLPDIMKKCLNRKDYAPKVINIPMENCTINEVTILEGKNFSEKYRKISDKLYGNSTYIYCTGTIKSLNMKNTTLSICANLVSDSTFENAENVIWTKYYMGYEKPLIINCTFKFCTNVIKLDEHTTVAKCIFKQCYGNLIVSYGEGGNIISDCHFVECKNDVKEGKYSRIVEAEFNEALIFFENGHDGKSNRIINCVFNGVKVNEGYIIATRALFKFSGYIVEVEKCDFKKCYTNRNDCKVIKEDVKYLGRFDRWKYDIGVGVYQCKGLDEIENDFIDDFDESEFYEFDE